MTPDQVRAGRKLLGWTITRLAAHSGLSAAAVGTFERTGRVVRVKSRYRTEHVDTLATMRTALEQAGVEFTNGDAPGVQLRERRA